MKANTLTLKGTLLLDAALLSAACLLPAFSHLLALPLYQFNPMLLLLLASLALVDDRRNAYLMALLLPVVSMLVVGMPTPAKALCMAAEYSAVVALYGVFSEHTRMGSQFSILLAMLAGKGVFYAFKAVVIAPVVLIGTSVWIQAISMLLCAALFAVIKELRQ